MLLEAQEEWVAEQGYKTLKVKSRNQFPAMLRLLLRNDYIIEKFEEKPTCVSLESTSLRRYKNK